MTIGDLIRAAYERFRTRRGFPAKWGSVEDRALRLASEHDEETLRTATAMRGAYERETKGY